MTSDYVIVSVKLCPNAGNDEYIIVCNFGSRRMSGFEVIKVASEAPAGRRKQKRGPVWKRINTRQRCIGTRGVQACKSTD